MNIIKKLGGWNHIGLTLLCIWALGFFIWGIAQGIPTASAQEQQHITVVKPANPKVVRHRFFDDESTMDNYVTKCISDGYIIKSVSIGYATDGGYAHGYVVAEKY